MAAAICMGVTLSEISYFAARHAAFTGIMAAVAMALLYAAPHVPAFPP